MDIELDQGFVTNAAELVDLARFNHEDVASGSLELDAVHLPQAAPFPDELNLIVWMAMGTGTATGKSTKEKSRDVDVAVIGADEFVRVEMVGQFLLPDPVHRASPRLDRRSTSDRDHVGLHSCIHRPSAEPLRNSLGGHASHFGQA